MITFDKVTKSYRRHCGSRRSHPRGADRDADGLRRSLRLRQTTSMRMINRMIDPTAGAITVDGRDIAGVDPVKLRLGIGYVIQSGGLMPHQRVVDNVATVPVLKGESRRAARKPPTASSNGSGWTPNSATATRHSCPAASSSGWGWPGRWPPTRRFC